MTPSGPERPDDRDGVVEIVMVGELDVARRELANALNEALDSGGRFLVVNLLDVSFIDSSVLRELLLAHREVRAREGWIRLVYTNHLIGRVISVTGLDEVLPQYTSVHGALASTARVGSTTGEVAE